MTAALSDELPFYDDPDECKPCAWCNKPMVRRNCTNPAYTSFRKRKTCSKPCKERLKSGVRPGQQWGYLTTLSYYGLVNNNQPRSAGNAAWQCKCICGDIIIVRANNLKHTLKRGNPVSCGCRGRVKPNQQFGMLKTIKKGKSYVAPNGDKYTRWVCQCTCGVVITALASHLLKGDTTSCGCKTTTRLEDAIERSLNRLNVYYKREYKPEALTQRGFHYRLDFYLPDYNLNIEADGKDFHGGGNQYKSAEEQIEHDDKRNSLVREFVGCYILRLSEDCLDGNPDHLDAKLYNFLLNMGEKPLKWLTYDFKTPC